MNAFQLLLDQSADRVGWVLVHTVWQGVLIAGLLAAILRLGRRMSSNARYVISCAALLGLVAAACVTFVILQPPRRPPTSTVAFAGPVAPPLIGDPIGVSTAIDRPISKAGNVRQAMPWLVGLWAMGVVVITLRQFLGWIMLQRWRRTAIAADELWNRRTSRLAQLMKARSTRLAISARVNVPIVVGIWRPMILAPIALFNGLEIAQVEAILAHELAHVRRHDYLANLIQVGIETLLFYHPCVWWISRQIRCEREFCCDEMAARVCGDPAEYAQALASLEILRPLALAPAATGTGRGELLARVRRLMGGRADEPRSRPAAGVMLLMILCIAGVISGRRLLAQATQSSGSERFGKVVDDSDQPVSGARIWQLQLSQDMRPPIVIATTISDDRGFFRLPRSGEVANLVIGSPGHAWNAAAIRWSTQDDPSVVQAPAPAKVRLHFLAPDYTPASGVRMRLAGFHAQGGRDVFLPEELDDPSVVQTTDAEGACIFDRLPREGMVLVEVVDDRFARLLGSERVIALSSTEVTDVEPILLRPAGSISGRVIYADSGRGIGGIQVIVLNGQGHSPVVITDDDGKYVMNHLSAGTYQINTILPESIELHYAAAALENVQVVAGATARDRDIKLVAGAEIRGKITDRATGKPLPDVAVHVDRQSARLAGPALVARSGADGVYQVHVIPGDLRAYLMSPLAAGLEIPDPSMYAVTIADNDTIERDFLIATHPLANVTGKTVGTEGHPIPGADILLQRKGEAPPGEVIANSDEKGNFSIPNLETSSRLRARKGKSSTLEHGEFKLDKTYVTLVLHPNAQSSIHALVRQADGTPIPAATVIVIKGNRSDGDTIQRTTGPDGTCVFTSLESDFGYQIKAYAKGFGLITNPVNVDKGKESQTSVILPKAESFVAGIVLDVNGAPMADKRVMLNSTLSAPQTVRTDITGHFRMDGIVAGDKVAIGVSEVDQYGSVSNVLAGTDNLIVNMRLRN